MNNKFQFEQQVIIIKQLVDDTLEGIYTNI